MARSDELKAQYESALAEESALNELREARRKIDSDPVAAKNAALSLRLARADMRMEKSLALAEAGLKTAEEMYAKHGNIDNAGLLIHARADVERLRRIQGQVDAHVTARSASATAIATEAS
jgi:hypothetical protein